MTAVTTSPVATPAAVARPFSTVLVANRGEIACRVMATLRRLGIRSVGVWSDADRDARHVALADLAVRLGPTEPRLSYLDVDAVVRAAVATGADAVHPGYGFLSENADLARACADAGIVFVGPGVRALDVMGDKIRAKDHVSAAGVPVIPGAPLTGDEEPAAVAARVGYPLLVKPSAGGGGKGMTVVSRPGDLDDALAASRRVARAAFGDDTLLLERYVRAPRHIEVQLLADAHGGVVHLGERECSLQRRHQKVVEEAPSSLLDAATRARIGAAACEVARSVDYVGAGTVEFLVSDEAPTEFFFMEMNTRLQVEHPVTELVTGLDLVEWQLRVAAGDPLGFAQDDVRLTGHAVEARVYAEDPSRDFLPTTGTVLVLDEPTGEGVRVDSALQPGLVVGTSYDPMLAKVVAWGADRSEALRRLDAALARTTILGVRTNVGFLRRVLADPDVRAGHLDTGLLARLDAAAPASTPVPDAACVAAVLWRRGPSTAAGPAWRPDGWRVTGAAPLRHWVLVGDEELEVRVTPAEAATPGRDRDVPVAVTRDGVALGEGARDGGGAGHVAVALGDGSCHVARLVRGGVDVGLLDLDGVTRPVRVAVDGDVTWVAIDGTTVDLRLRGPAEHHAARLAARRADAPGSGGSGGTAAPEVRAPMPGVVVAVDAATGDHVVAGQPLLTIEAMKMEHRLAAPRDGVVTLTVRPADRVSLDHVVATITPHPHEGTPE